MIQGDSKLIGCRVEQEYNCSGALMEEVSERCISCSRFPRMMDSWVKEQVHIREVRIIDIKEQDMVLGIDFIEAVGITGWHFHIVREVSSYSVGLARASFYHLQGL